MLLVFDTEDDWLLVQNSKAEGKAGYVPGNYVEVVNHDESHAPSRIVVPDSVRYLDRYNFLKLTLHRSLHPRSATTLTQRIELPLSLRPLRMISRLGHFQRSIRKERKRKGPSGSGMVRYSLPVSPTR